MRAWVGELGGLASMFGVDGWVGLENGTKGRGVRLVLRSN